MIVFFAVVGVITLVVLLLKVLRWWRRDEIRERMLREGVEEEIDVTSDERLAAEKFRELSSGLRTKAREGKPLTYEDTCAVLKEYIGLGLFDATSLKRENSRKLFRFHRLVGGYDGDDVDGGLLVRTTVQLNLFGGSVANLGNEEQCKWLSEEVFAKGQLGAFLLTESKAGVLSGLVVETECRVDKESKCILLTSPNPTAETRKTWISQGLTGKYGVVIARLLLADGTDKGAHAFIVDMEQQGVHRVDMTPKTAFNSLDNAHIHFENVSLPFDSLLSGDCYIDDNGEYHLHSGRSAFNFVKVGQRLLSGRIALSAFSLHRVRAIVRRVHEYTRQRQIPLVGSAHKGEKMALAAVPVIRDSFRLFYKRWNVYSRFVEALEKDYADVSKPLSFAMVHRINTAKIAVVEFAMDSLYDLKKKVGAYSLLARHDDGLLGAFNAAHVEIFYLVRFAEGDSGILKQKMARDALRPISKPAGLIRTVLSLPILWLRHHLSLYDATHSALYRLQHKFHLLHLALRMLQVKGSAIAPQWLRNYPLVERCATHAALLTIVDSLGVDAKLLFSNN